MDDSNYSYGIRIKNPDFMEEGDFKVTASLKDGTEIGGDTKREVQKMVHDHFYSTSDAYREWWDAEIARELQVNKITIPTDKLCIGSVSLVGVGGEFPLRRGNYFSIHVPDFQYVGVINFWYENLKEAIERFEPKELHLEVFENGGGVIITAPEFPDDWMIKNLFMEYNCSLDEPSKHKILHSKGLDSWLTSA